MSQSRKSVTKTTESGAFYRVTIRSGKHSKQQTKRLKKNDKKVILGYIGDFEVYCYPYDYPDSVFIGSFPISTKIDLSNVRQLISVFNKARNYLNGNYFSEAKTSKGAKSRRQAIQRAYSCGLIEQRSKEKASFH